MLIKENQYNNILKINELEWDSSILGFKSAYIDFDEENCKNIAPDILDALIKNALKKAHNNGFKFLTAKINSENLSLVNACVNNLGILVDIELTFAKTRIDKVNNNISDNFKIEKHEKYWDESLLEIIKTLKYSRFFVDKNIDQHLSQKIWETSIYNSCNGRASYNIVCFDKTKPIGLMNIYEKEFVSDIFLIALIPKYQGLGLGKAMMGFYEKHLDDNIKTQKVETQLINYHAQNLYTSCNYKNFNSKHTLHFWL